jgi:uncharacterized protein YdbL (DUF1318 family)
MQFMPDSARGAKINALPGAIQSGAQAETPSMKRAFAVTGLTGLLGLALLAGCVTVNVYFPAAQAQQAADKIIDAVTGSTAGPATQQPPSKPQSAPGDEPPSSDRGIATAGSVLLAATGRVLQLLVPPAAAQEQANLDISTPEIRAIIGSMRQRFQQHLKPYFVSGAVGLTADGVLAVRDPSSVPLSERATLVRVVAQQNQDLSLLYGEIAKANGHPEWASDIRTVFAQRWKARARQRGWYYRDSGGNWARN